MLKYKIVHKLSGRDVNKHDAEMVVTPEGTIAYWDEMGGWTDVDNPDDYTVVIQELPDNWCNK